MTNNVTSGPFLNAGQNAPSFVFDSNNTDLYFGDDLYSTLDVLDSSNNTFLPPIPFAFSPGPIDLDRTNGNIYVGNSLANDIAVVNGSTNKIETDISVPGVPSEIMWDSLNSLLYVLTDGENFLQTPYSSLGGNGTNDLSIINCTSNSIMGTLPVGSDPLDLALDFYNGQLSISNYGFVNLSSGNLTGSGVTIVNTTSNTVSSFTGLSDSLGGIIFDSYVGDFYVQYWTENITGVVALNSSTGSIIATIPIGPYPASGSDPQEISNGDSNLNGQSPSLPGSNSNDGPAMELTSGLSNSLCYAYSSAKSAQVH